MSTDTIADTVDKLLHFWFETLTPKDWYRPPPRVDADIERRFRDTYEALKDGVPEAWLATPRGVLAAILVLDQLPRNMFRGTAQAFATDGEALALAKRAIAEGMDERLPPAKRAFVYLPFQHAEDADDQARSVALFTALGNPLNLDYAIRHQDVVMRFGRFPHRNKILGRASTPEEEAFLEQPGSSF
jgi:uncharacterized protein (DUF924 family)